MGESQVFVHLSHKFLKLEHLKVKRPLAKIVNPMHVIWFYNLLQEDKGYIVRKANGQAIKQNNSIFL